MQHISSASSLTNPTIIFPVGLPTHYNLSAKATVLTHGQTVEHYYQSATNADDDAHSSHMHPLYASIVVVIILGVCVTVFLCRRSIRSKQRAEEMEETGETAKGVEMREPAEQGRREVNVDLLGGEDITPEPVKKEVKKGYREMIEEL